jgi:hypothetical protein
MRSTLLSNNAATNSGKPAEQHMMVTMAKMTLSMHNYPDSFTYTISF